MKRIISSLFFLIIIPLILPPPALTQNAGARDLFDMSLEDLLNIRVVSASRKAQLLREAPANVIVITADVIRQRGYLSLEEILRDLPGFDFTSSQPSGEYPTHFIFRGVSDAGQTKMLVMVDGIIRNDISNGWSRFTGYNLPMTDIERVEVIGGPGSALYGANAFTGLIHVITRSAAERFSNKLESNLFMDVSMITGEHHTAVPEIFVGYQFGDGLIAQLSGRWHFTDGDGGDRYDPGNYFHNNCEPDSVFTTEYGNIYNERNSDGSRKRLPDGFKTNINDVTLRGRVQKDGFKIGFTFWNKNEGLGSEVVGYEYFANDSAIDYKIHHAGYTIFSDYSARFGDKIESKSRLYHRNTRVLPETGFVYTYRYQSVANGLDPPVIDKKKGYHGEGFVTRFEQQIDVNTSATNDLTVGFHVEQKIDQYFGISLGSEQEAGSSIVGSTFTSEEESVQPMYFSKNAAFYAQNEHRFRDHFLLTAGLRFDASNQHGNVWNPRLALIGTPTDLLHFKLLYGEAYKAPTVFELFDEWRGNGDIQSEKIRTFEIETVGHVNSSNYVMLNYFHSQLDDLIAEQPNPDTSATPIGPLGQKATYYQNVGSTSISGFTVSAALKPVHNVSLVGNYTLTLGDNWQELDNVAKHKVNVIFNGALENTININVRGNWVGRVKAPSTNRYFYPKTEAAIAAAGYDYMNEGDPDGYLESCFLVHLTLTGKTLFSLFDRKLAVEPQIIVKNALDKDYVLIGRQSGSGVRPVDEAQPLIQNPQGFIPAYHPQPGREIYIGLKCHF